MESVYKNIDEIKRLVEIDQIDCTIIENKTVDKIDVTNDDFMRAIEFDIKPMFGKEKNNINLIVEKNKLLLDNEQFNAIYTTSLDLIENLPKTNILSIVIQGYHLTGKTLLACNLATKSNYVCQRILSPSDFLSKNDYEKCELIKNLFDQVTKSESGFLIMDQFERLIEWSPLGYKYNNMILQTILTLSRSMTSNRTVIVLTITQTKNSDLLELLELDNFFDHTYLV